MTPTHHKGPAGTRAAARAPVSATLWASARLWSLPRATSSVSAVAIRPWGAAHEWALSLEKSLPSSTSGELASPARTHSGPSWGRGPVFGGESGRREGQLLRPPAGPRDDSTVGFPASAAPWQLQAALEALRVFSLSTSYSFTGRRGEAGRPPGSESSLTAVGTKTGLEVGTPADALPPG